MTQLTEPTCPYCGSHDAVVTRTDEWYPNLDTMKCCACEERATWAEFHREVL